MARSAPIAVANSSWVKTIDYSAGTLTVITKKNAPIYFFQVPPSLWEQLQAAPSKGEFINKHIKRKFMEA